MKNIQFWICIFYFLAGTEISEEQLRILLTLSQLESLDIKMLKSFYPIEMPEMMNLSKFKLEYDFEFFDIASFCQALKKMPKLKDLEVNDVSSKYEFHTNDISLKLVQQIVSMAASQNKDILILKKSWGGEISDKWKVERKTAESDEASQSLNLTVSFDYKKPFLSKLQAFVGKDVKSHDFLILESTPDSEDDSEEDSFNWGED